MATFPVDVTVGFLDSAERTAERVYRLVEQYDDVALNFDDVMTAALALETALNVLTMDHIDYIKVAVIGGGGGAAANIAANNQITGFTRLTDAVGEKAYFEVPAWDDVTFDQDSNNLLSAAYNTAAAAVALLTVNPANDETWTVDWSQSRTRKSGVKLS